MKFKWINRTLLPAILAAAIITRIFPDIKIAYYAAPVILAYIFIVSFRDIFNNDNLRSFLILIFIFIVWSAATSLWSLYPGVSLSRTYYLLLISFAGTLAGFIYAKGPEEQSKNTLREPGYLLYANIIILLICLFSLISGLPANAWTGGNERGFMGFAGHQNTLAAGILFTIPASVFAIIKGRNSKSEKSKVTFIFYIVLFVLNVAILLLTYSRTSIAALILVFLIFFLFIYKRKAVFVYAVTAALITAAVFISPAVKNDLRLILKKDFPSILFTREILIKPSLKAAEHGGLIGLGYGVSDPDIIVPGTGSHYEGPMYIREKGNSILAIIEETGYIGLVLFIIPLIFVFYILFKRIINYPDPDLYKKFMILNLSFFLAFIFHSMFEAWWVGVGSVQLPLFFMFMGFALRSWDGKSIAKIQN